MARKSRQERPGKPGGLFTQLELELLRNLVAAFITNAGGQLPTEVHQIHEKLQTLTRNNEEKS